MATKGEAEGIARRHRGRLVRVLERDGLLADRRWRTAFADVPRHMFLPRFFRPVSPTEWAAIDSSDDDWLTQVYANRVLVTQLDGDPARWELARAGGRISGVPTSSSSMPAIMAVMLEALDVVDGNQVLEIGTGTGYNAALLCHRLGADHLTTVDIDAELVDAARQRLAAIGYRPTCAATDGAAGYPPRASYDRVVCTCAVSTVPLPWLAQTRPGGIVVTTLNRPLGAGLVRITVDADGTGQGRVLADDGRFMPLRAHRRHPRRATRGTAGRGAGGHPRHRGGRVRRGQPQQPVRVLRRPAPARHAAREHRLGHRATRSPGRLLGPASHRGRPPPGHRGWPAAAVGHGGEGLRPVVRTGPAAAVAVRHHGRPERPGAVAGHAGQPVPVVARPDLRKLASRKSSSTLR
jgi:protein-L-isoaspartate O-methyltransferase